MTIKPIPECLPIARDLDHLRDAIKPTIDTRVILRLVLKGRTDAKTCQEICKELLNRGVNVYSGDEQLHSNEEIDAEYLIRLQKLEGYERIALNPSFSETAGGTLETHESTPDGTIPALVKQVITNSSLRASIALFISDRHTIRDHMDLSIFKLEGRFREKYLEGHQITISSSFNSKDIAEWAIGIALSFYEPTISEWLAKSSHVFKNIKDFFALILPVFDFGIPIGCSLIISEDEPRSAMSIRIMLVRHLEAPKGFYIKTAYPT